MRDRHEKKKIHHIAKLPVHQERQKRNKEPVQLGGGRKEFLHLMMFELNF